MECPRVRHLLQEYLEGWLPDGPAAEVEEHLGACPRCSRELEQFAALDRALWRQPRLTVPQGFKDAVMARLPGGETPQPLGLERWIPMILATAAAVALLLTGAFGGVEAAHGQDLLNRGADLAQWTGATVRGTVREAIDRGLGADPLALAGMSPVGTSSTVFAWLGALSLAMTLGLLRRMGPARKA